MAAAEAVCLRNGARLTDIRRRVLELIWESHRPVKAYDLLERLAAERGPVKPPTVYRALDFLLDNGLIHRVEALNAVIGCAHPDTADHPDYFLICDRCETVTELAAPAFDDALRAEAGRRGFAIKRQSVEIFGRCTGCQDG